MCICLSQIWDFNLGRLRGSGPLELGQEPDDAAGFTIKAYQDFSREVSVENTKGSGDFYSINCSMPHDDILSFKV